MNTFLMIKRIFCVGCAAVLALSITACGKNKTATTTSSVSSPFLVEDTGRIVKEGYEMPYQYSDGYKAVAMIPDNSTYQTATKTPAGNIKFQLTTTESLSKVKSLYNNYFAKLPKVKAKAKTDKSTGYYDKEKRLIIFNFHAWTADGKTVYSFGAAQCEDISKNQVWVLDKQSATKPSDKSAAQPTTKAAAKTATQPTTKPTAKQNQSAAK